jgi:hypothetical protein
MSDRLRPLALQQAQRDGPTHLRAPAGPGPRFTLQRRRPTARVGHGSRGDDRRVTSDSLSATPGQRTNLEYGYWRRIVSNEHAGRHDSEAVYDSTTMAIIRDLEVEHERNRIRNSVNQLSFPNPYSTPSSPIIGQWDVHPPAGPSGISSWDGYEEVVRGWKGRGGKRKAVPLSSFPLLSYQDRPQRDEMEEHLGQSHQDVRLKVGCA